MDKVYILILTVEDELVDSATYFYRDKIIGCYSTAWAANRAGGNLGDICWRIEEQAVTP